MGLVPKFTNASIDAYLKKRATAIRQAIINRLIYLGEACVREARTNHSYIDRTDNLTSSMGYVVVVNGRIVTTAGFGGKEGATTGRTFAQSLAANHTSGYALYVVAGMNYAAYVEAKGYNVLTTAESFAESQLPIMLEQLKRNIDENNA